MKSWSISLWLIKLYCENLKLKHMKGLHLYSWCFSQSSYISSLDIYNVNHIRLKSIVSFFLTSPPHYRVSPSPIAYNQAERTFAKTNGTCDINSQDRRSEKTVSHLDITTALYMCHLTKVKCDTFYDNC